MIEASFNQKRSNDAAISGAYQYDTGQRVRLVGLPSPAKMAEKDDFLSGTAVSVEVQYGRKGDQQTESRIAVWDTEKEVWMAEVPDVYMRQAEPVYMYIYVGFGTETEQGVVVANRNKTYYEATFTPQARPAPSTEVTPAQTSAWDALVAEVNLALTTVGTATSNANAAATLANEAAATANTAADNADDATGDCRDGISDMEDAVEQMQSDVDDAIDDCEAATAACNTATAACNTATGNANTATAACDTATAACNTATGNANTATAAANSAATNANTVATNVSTVSASASGLPAGSSPTASATYSQSGLAFAFGIPKGDKGDKGDTGPAGVTFTLVGTTLYITTDQ